MSDAIRDTFLALMKQGMTPLEALREFDRDEWNKAMTAEIESETCFFNRETFHYETPDGKPSLLDLGGMAQREKCDEAAMEQAVELWFAGWTSEAQSKNAMVMSWYWRRPPRRKGGLGMRFLSTNQAYTAMKKEITRQNEGG